MSDNSSIEWTDSTWNPVTGCTKVSPGCDNCYAERVTNRFAPGSFDTVRLHPERLDKPLRWRKPRRVFVNSMSDLFHHDVPDEFIARVFAVMALTPQHTFQILTKRHARMRALLSDDGFESEVSHEIVALTVPTGPTTEHLEGFDPWWPLSNVWLGVSVEDQKRADVRIPALVATPAAVRFVSCEPLLGPLNLHVRIRSRWGGMEGDVSALHHFLDWIIVGGESGPGARPMQPEWAQKIRDDCEAASVPFFFKQWGGTTPKSGGRLLDGREWSDYPKAAAHA